MAVPVCAVMAEAKRNALLIGMECAKISVCVCVCVSELQTKLQCHYMTAERAE